MSLLIWQAVLATCLSNLIFSVTSETIGKKTDFPNNFSVVHFERSSSIMCPNTKDTREAVYFPYPSDCGLYYICEHGLPRLRTCQPGLHFNPSLKACDFPQEAGCDTAVSPKPKGRNVEDEFEVCPAGNPKYPVLLPHPTDCGQFYICNHGSPLLQTCQSGLHFSQELKACDYPEKAGCDKGVPVKPKGREAEDDDESGMCPSSDPRYPVLLPHPSDCTKFYICSHGSPHLQKCQSGLHFSQKLKACDYPEKAGCEKSVTEKPKGRIIDDDDLGVCPSVNSEFPVFVQHPTDCSKYFICDSGSPHLKTCQRGLHFNLKLKACDYPENVDCDKSVTEKPRGRLFDDDDLGICPTVNSEFPVFVPHPTDCSKYFMCDNGSPHLKTCQSGLHFNLKLKACDYPESADCDREFSTVLAAPGVSSSFCPPEDGKLQIFFRHPSNCSIYYMCSHGSAYKFVCPARLHFNLLKKQCDYEIDARCFSDN